MEHHQQRQRTLTLSNLKKSGVDLDEIEDLLDMIFAENVEEEPLDNEEIVEILDLVSKEAFKKTEVMKVGFKEIETSMLKC